MLENWNGSTGMALFVLAMIVIFGGAFALSHCKTQVHAQVARVDQGAQIRSVLNQIAANLTTALTLPLYQDLFYVEQRDGEVRVHRKTQCSRRSVDVAHVWADPTSDRPLRCHWFKPYPCPLYYRFDDNIVSKLTSDVLGHLRKEHLPA